MSEQNGQQPVPLTSRERELLAPDIQDLTQAAVQFAKAKERLGRMAKALRTDGAQLDPTELVWILPHAEESEADARPD